MTHPFHPWSGQEFELVTYLHTWGEHRAYFRHEGEHLVSVPATWTDIVAEDPVVLLGAGRSLFRVTDLLELTELIERLRQPTVKETMP
ncbi:MAG: Y4bD/Y4pK family protein [Bryobacterales bacterium]|nr:Y4bD/Y4pK family protein [Bryobacterales bacterium]